MRPFISTMLLIAANLLMPIAVYIFATGFFPYKPFLPGLAQYTETDILKRPHAPFDRLVFMVVDALRSDFVYLNGTGFQYTQRLIADGTALPFTAHATSPTITMPRIKAITTGSIPSFLDVILNFDEADTSSTLAMQDTWLAQMKAKRTGKLVLYGDDTWLKLFPDTFDRADGTTSFFVSDFTEVDNNVTRHIGWELGNDDWNTMVLHYLGLDHIGHKAGPRSPNMIPKQREMDGIVKVLVEAMTQQPALQSTLLVLCGDHGMNDAGNHGASSPGETSPALVFISPKLRQIAKSLETPAQFQENFRYYSVVEQSDLVPSLGALLGFPVPKNNLGALIPDFLPLWVESDGAQLLLENGDQIHQIIRAALDSSQDDQSLPSRDCSELPTELGELACQWEHLRLEVENVRSDHDVYVRWASKASMWLHRAQSFLSSMASNYDIFKLFLGLGAGLGAFALAIVAAHSSNTISTWSLVPLALTVTAYGAMMFASSYVEEEQHFWYWSTSAWLVFIYLRRKLEKSDITTMVLALVAFRVVRAWNQTGQKFAGEPDIVKMYLVREPLILWSLIFLAYIWVLVALLRDLQEMPPSSTIPAVTVLIIAAASFKLAFTNEDAPELVVGLAQTMLGWSRGASLVAKARAVFVGLFAATLYPLYLISKKKRDSSLRAVKILHHLYTILALTQSRATNIPLFLLFQALYYTLYRLDMNAEEITMSTLFLQFTSFFAMGGTNAISSVDLSSAYNGISGFNVVAVGILTFVSNWAGPVWWASAANLLLVTQKSRGGVPERVPGFYMQYVTLMTVTTLAGMVAVMAACTILRTHLFIWTVFSPKYLYIMAWSLGHHLGVNVGLCGLLFWLGS